MSLSAASARERWELNGAKDPLFAAYDGSNCPTQPQTERASHSLLIDHGLIRIARQWPPRDFNGTPIKPDFRIEVVNDPTGCNVDPEWGLKGGKGHISIFRRPRPVANFKYIEAIPFAADPKRSLPVPVDPETHQPVSGNLMADGRVLSLTSQLRDASQTHLEFLDKLSNEDERKILDFERRLFAAQQVSNKAGPLDAAGAEGGPRKLVESEPGRLGSQGVPVWSEFQPWEKTSADVKRSLPAETLAFRESVARGARSFRERTFLISDAAPFTYPSLFGNPTRNGCAFCHNMSQMGMDAAPGQIDLGTTVLPFADPQPWLPVFRITCLGTQHPYYGKVFYTHDPGYGLTTGRCADVGRITLQALRGLSARAPYFANGSAATLRAVIDFYDRRYNIAYTEREKQDLVNLLSVL